MLRRLLPPYTSGSADTVFGVLIYGNPSYDRLWFRLTFRLFRRVVLRPIDRLYYWLSHRTVDRYHIVRTGLSPGYYDVDEVMFRACFALLGRFVERELGRAAVDDEPDQHYRWYRVHCTSGTDEVAIDLWCWYREQLPVLDAIDARELGV